MLGSSERMNRERFNAVFSKSTVFHTPHFFVRSVVSSQDGSHGAVVVSKKVSNRAVLRNRLKRRIYSSLKDFFRSNPIPIDVIVVTKRGAASLSTEALRAELQTSLQKIHTD